MISSDFYKSPVNKQLLLLLFLLVALCSSVFAQSKVPGYHRVKVKQGQTLRINKDSLFTHYKDTILLIPKGTSYEFVEQNKKSDQGFYDSLKIKYGNHKITDLLFNVLLVNTDTSGKYQKKQALIKSEQAFLPHKGLIIEKIVLKKVAVISGSVHDTTKQITTWAGRVIDKAHIYSKDRIILNNLLFNKADKISAFVLADNERLLRSLPFIEDAKIIVTKDPTTSLATITVITKDVWSIGFAVGVDDFHEYDLEIYDRNFLGQGSEFSNTALINTKEKPKIGYNGNYTVNNIKGTFINSFIQYKTVYNEEIARLKFDKLFLTPQTKYAGGLDIFRRSFIDQIVTDNLEVIEENITSNKQGVWIGRSINMAGNQNRRSLIFSVAYSNTTFPVRPAEVSENFYFDYHDSKLLLGKISITQRNYYKGNFVNRFGITEDIPVGSIISFTTGKKFGEFKHRPYFSISYTKSLVTSKTEYWTGNVSFSNFINKDKNEDALFNASVLYFSRLKTIHPKYKFRYQAKLFYTKGIKRVNHDILTITEQKSIRGFNESNLTGTERLSLKLEGDIITFWNLYGFRFIPYSFMDFGLINHTNSNLFSTKNFYAGIGVGVRIRNESLVFSTFELRFAYYPKLYENTQQYVFDFFSDSPFSFQELNDAKPQIERLE